MDIELIKRLLPEHPRKGMIEEIRSKYWDEFGPNFTVFHRESLTIRPYDIEMLNVMTYEQAIELDSKAKRKWGAVVKCTSCGEEYFAGYFNDKYTETKGIILANGEDGTLYPGFVDESNPDKYLQEVGDSYVKIAADEEFFCPYCEECTHLINKSNIRAGRKYSLQVCSVENIGKYTALVHWIIVRTVNGEYGYSQVEAVPREALVIDDNGSLKRFIHCSSGQFGCTVRLNAWEYRRSFADSMQAIYHDYASYFQKKKGSVCWDDVPDLAGTTGEKTGIAEYIHAGGNWPAIYLKTHRKYPAIENLLKSGWGKAIVQDIHSKMDSLISYDSRIASSLKFYWGNWDYTKPSEILSMSRQEANCGVEWAWSSEVLFEWWIYKDTKNHCTATVFNEFLELVKIKGIKQTMDMLGKGNQYFEIPRLMNYFKKFPDFIPADTLQMLVDVHKMHEDIYHRAPETNEQAYPKNLMEVHERYSNAVAYLNNAKTNKSYKRGFEEIYKEFKSLQWNDGSLCIKLPRTNDELIKEGDILRHCVGGYGQAHIDKKDVIFFVRKYRRSERSYYTLDIRFSDGAPYEVQLHGYGNERHGPNKEYNHTKPQKVLDFVERWKKEVLMPWYREQIRLKREKAIEMLKSENKSKENIA